MDDRNFNMMDGNASANSTSMDMNNLASNPEILQLIQWLNNKYGSASFHDVWSPPSACSLNSEKLKLIQQCLPSLTDQVKVNLLNSFLHLPQRSIALCRDELIDIARSCAEDKSTCQLWLHNIAKIVLSYISTGHYSLEMDDSICPGIGESIAQIRRCIKAVNYMTVKLQYLPAEYSYINKAALKNVFNSDLPPTPKPFNLVRRSKSYVQRNEILSKVSNMSKAKRLVAVQEKSNSISNPAFENGVITNQPARKVACVTSIQNQRTPGFLRPNSFQQSSVHGTARQRPVRDNSACKVQIIDLEEQRHLHSNMKKRKKRTDSSETKKTKGDANSRKNAVQHDQNFCENVPFDIRNTALPEMTGEGLHDILNSTFDSNFMCVSSPNSKVDQANIFGNALSLSPAGTDEQHDFDTLTGIKFDPVNFRATDARDMY